MSVTYCVVNTKFSSEFFLTPLGFILETLETLDTSLLERLQFAFTISFLIIFPAFTIGLSAFIATLVVLCVSSGKEHYQQHARVWTKIFAVSFAMGVVSG